MDRYKTNSSLKIKSNNPKIEIKSFTQILKDSNYKIEIIYE